MDTEDVSMLWQAITPLEAREVLVSLRIADHPHMKPEDRRKFADAMVDAGYPHAVERAASWEDVAHMFGQTSVRIKDGR